MEGFQEWKGYNKGGEGPTCMLSICRTVLTIVCFCGDDSRALWDTEEQEVGTRLVDV